MIEKLFRVVTEFQFEIAGALAGTDQLSSGLKKVEEAADSVQSKLLSIPLMLAGSFAGYATVSNIFQAAVGSQQKLQASSLSMANVISSNMESMSGDVETFSDRLLASRQIIESVAKTANKFNLDESAMVETFKAMSAMLAPKGLAGQNFGVAAELSRGLLKSAPILGVDPSLVQNQLREIIEGRAGMQNTLFSRLSAETPAFQGMGGKGGKKTDSIAKVFNALPPAERLDRLRKGLLTFASDIDVIGANARLLSSIITGVKNQIFGINSILRPLGEVIVPRLEKALIMVSDAIETYARPFLEKFAVLVDKAFANPARAWATLQQLRNVNKDLERTGSLMQIIGLVDMAAFAGSFVFTSKAVRGMMTRGGLLGLVPAFNALGIVFEFLHKKIGAFTGTDAIANAYTRIRKATDGSAKFLASFGFVGSIFGFLIKRVLVPLGLVTVAMNILSRSAAYAAVELKMKWFNLAKEFVTGAGARIISGVWDIMRIFDELADRMARSMTWLAGSWIDNMKIWIASTSGLAVVNAVAAGIELLRDGLINLLSGLAWMGTFIWNLPEQIINNFAALSWETNKALVNIGLLFKAFFADMAENLKTPFMGILSALDYAYRGHFLMAKGALENAFGGEGNGTNNLEEAFKRIGFTGENFSNPFEQANADLMQIRNDLTAGFGKGPLDEKVVVNRNINQNVNINQSFREQQEPDRIARSLVKTLQEIADNPRQAGGRRGTMSGAFIGATQGL